MRFGKSLQDSIYESWRAQYIDYSKLKKLLREDGSPSGRESAHATSKRQDWTEEDESAFVDELVNVQLEKVNAFHNETYKNLRDRTTECESELQEIAARKKNGASEISESNTEAANSEDQTLPDMLEKLDGITKEIGELEKYSRINFTGFLKAAKKHDRRRGTQYRVRPLLRVRLAALPFNSEDYSPLLYQLSAMYSFVRQELSKARERTNSDLENKENMATYTSFKFWVHPENLLEVKTYILRRLPVLVYNPQSSKGLEGGQHDPRITSLYFDNPDFSLYTDKVGKTAGASSLRLRWFGHLNTKPEIYLEKKTTEESGDSDEIRIPLKMKYIQDFIAGNYRMEKSLARLKERQGSESDFVRLKSNVDAIQSFIKEKELQPVLRANYKRTAFQIPGDDNVRISLDTDVAFIREDSLDQERPCRDPHDWHRTDIDASEMEYPFNGIRQGEISRFPYALLEIKVRSDAKRKTNDWVSDLMSSHLIKGAPRFSKFVHGVAQLFEDHVNSFPFWLSGLETDIRRDPETAFQEEQEKKAKHAEEEQAVGSFMGSRASHSFTAAIGSPIARSTGMRGNMTASNMTDKVGEKSSTEEEQEATPSAPAWRSQGLQSFLPSFSRSKYGRSRRRESVPLPPGVREPGRLTKDTGPVQVEPKVWLANQRTFVKWQHISVLLATLSLSLYNAAKENNNVARSLAVAYTLVAAAVAGWGWWIYNTRSRMIQERSGREFDNIYGPIAVCLALIIALCLNLGLRYQAVFHEIAMQAFHECHTQRLWVRYLLLGAGSQDTVLNLDEALSLIAQGAVHFKGFSKPAHHAVDPDAHFFPLLGLENGQRILEAGPSTETLSDCASFSLDENMDAPEIWNTLEQPSMRLCFGRYAGTMTFSRYIGRKNHPAPQVNRPAEILLRRIDLSQILERLRFLQDAREVPFEPTEQEEAFLYGQLLVDPTSNCTNGTLERDIWVLSSFLESQAWTDFSDCGKQFVAIYHAAEAYDTEAETFFHQILLSTELDRRISLYQVYTNHGTEQSMSTLPRKVAWSVALSRRFFQNLAFEPGNYHSLVPQSKIAHLERVLHVGYTLKWPDMDKMEARMIVENESKMLQCNWTVPSATFLCGTISPGPTASWMVLSCLLDCNPAHRITLGGLNAMHPQSGFQYEANTYWYWECIVGKVLGAMQGSHCTAGWIGPCVYTTDLHPVEYVRVYLKRAPKRMKKRDLRTLAARSDPLGSSDSSYPVSNFRLVMPNRETIVDTVRVEKLAIRVQNAEENSNAVEHKVAVRFAHNGDIHTIRLRYDVSFIAAAACWAGPHVLSYEYAYKFIRVDKLLKDLERAGNPGERNATGAVWTEHPGAIDDDTVLVIEAYGATDNAVLARAWCAYLGLSAVVADIKYTCLACTIREAYAACIVVAIVTDTSQPDDVEPVPRSSAPDDGEM
ncbi:MAG: hypothetical protein Q9188_005131 [Gyalolechia gomerana]